MPTVRLTPGTRERGREGCVVRNTPGHKAPMHSSGSISKYLWCVEPLTDLCLMSSYFGGPEASPPTPTWQLLETGLVMAMLA